MNESQLIEKLRGGQGQPFTLNFSWGDHGRDSVAHICPTPPMVQSSPKLTFRSMMPVLRMNAACANP